jgi:hypothetical protein
MAVFLTALTALITTHLFGLRMFEISELKLGASQQMPHVFNPLLLDMKSARMLRVGTGNETSFTEAAANTPQRGNALQIHASTDPSLFIRYYVDSADNKLKRRAEDGSIRTITTSVTNAVAFTVEDFAGQVLTNRASRALIGVSLQFSAVGNGEHTVGAARSAQGYRLQTKIALLGAN